MTATRVSKRTVRVVEVDADRLTGCPSGIEDIYTDQYDVLLIRRAFERDILESIGKIINGGKLDLDWIHPNPPEMEGENIQVLGMPLTPTGKTPMGPELNSYLDANDQYRNMIDKLCGEQFQPQQAIETILSKISGGRRVEVPGTGNQRDYATYTVRLLHDGQGIGVHHDNHFSLPVYAELAAQASTETALSFITPLSVPQTGGELVVYALTLDNPDKPMLPNGRWDPVKVAERYHHVELAPEIGDLVVFASGRLLHQVTPVVGPVPRITMGGFLSFDRDWKKVWYWS